jgi:hypothetical protein
MNACVSKASTAQYSYKFSSESISDWNIVNDGVMGGLSKGSFEVQADGNGKFFGSVSTENNGGFTMMRHGIPKVDASKYTQVQLYLKGDGKDYQLRIKDSQKHYYSYVKSFSTSGDWETVTIDLADMYPSLMGQHLNMPNFDQSSIAEIAFLISNKVAEDFELIIKEIKFI